MQSAFIHAALESVFPGKWDDWMPDFAAAATANDIGVLVIYHDDRLKVATHVLGGLGLSDELLSDIAKVNVGLPIGGLTLSQAPAGWVATWSYKILERWVDIENKGTQQMIFDILNNAETMTNLAGERLQPAHGGARLRLDDGWPLVVMSHT